MTLLSRSLRHCPGSLALGVALMLAAVAGVVFGADVVAPAGYAYQARPAAGGTGKQYMGREIAQVMGHDGAAWLDRGEREKEERTDLLIRNLPIKPSDTVADIGAGTGYFSFRLSPLLTKGKVIAVDIQPEMLSFIEKARQQSAVTNVDTRLASETDPGLSRASVDLALLVDAYHEFIYPREVMQNIVQALKPGGLVALVEYRGEDAAVPIKPLHKMTQTQVKTELAAAGLVWRETKEVLPWQHLMIFSKP